MKHFPENIKFAYSWRSYQSEVLGDFEKFLENETAHIVAPPGSGKTVLGLELMLRLNKPTIIFVPTVTLREQWINRFKDLFLQSEELPNWISEDITTPKLLTVVTYQGVHAAFRNILQGEKVKQQLINNGTAVLIFDEAHHLKREWWRVIFEMKNILTPQCICLTATPPYDSRHSDWANYFELAGEIDIEIQIPDLVKHNELCPHQDFIYLCQPTKDERKLLKELQLNNTRIIEKLKSDYLFVKALKQHDMWQKPEHNFELIYQNYDVYISLLSFLDTCDVPVSEIHYEILGINKLPSISNQQMSILLQFFLFDDADFFKTNHTRIYTEIKDELTKAKMIYNKRVFLEDTEKMTKYLSTSTSKINAVVDIIDIEMNPDLCFLVLTDFIKENNVDNDMLGVIPIFEKVMKAHNAKVKVATVTGSVTIFPKSAFASFEAYFMNIGKPVPNVVDYNDSHYIIKTQTRKPGLVEAMTYLLQTGEVDGFIGTKALLGEGWDAPRINTLILASNIGTFVSSNQMRGRAIRADNANSNKIAHIWHIGCVDIKNAKGGYDIQIVSDRFAHFMGLELSDNPSYISTGIKRMKLPREFSKENVRQYYEMTYALAKDRHKIAKQWQKNIAEGTVVTERINLPSLKTQKNVEASARKIYKFNRTLRKVFPFYMALAALCATLYLAYLPTMMALNETFMIETLTKISLTILTMFGLGFLFLFVGITISERQYVNLMGDLQAVSKVIIDSLIEMKLISSNIQYKIEQNELSVYGNVYEQRLITTTLQELFEPIVNPRYLILWKDVGVMQMKRDKLPVPEVFANHKDTALIFKKHWKQHLGKVELVYTRNPIGHKMLIKARANNLNNEHEQSFSSSNVWDKF